MKSKNKKQVKGDKLPLNLLLKILELNPMCDAKKLVEDQPAIVRLECNTNISVALLIKNEIVTLDQVDGSSINPIEQYEIFHACRLYSALTGLALTQKDIEKLKSEVNEDEDSN